MFFIQDANTRAKIWKIDLHDKYADVRISTSERKRDGSGYINSNWFARFIGHAFQSVKECSEGDSIFLRNVKISNEPYEKDGERRSALRVAVMSFDTDEDSAPRQNSKPAQKHTAKPASKPAPKQDDDEMPF